MTSYREKAVNYKQEQIDRGNDAGLAHGVQGGGEIRGHNDDLDAFRHAYSWANLSKKYGPEIASLIGRLNEVDSKDERETYMDLHNNAVGIAIANRTPRRTMPKTIAHAVKAGVTINGPYKENRTNPRRTDVSTFLDASDLFNLENRIAERQQVQAATPHMVPTTDNDDWSQGDDSGMAPQGLGSDSAGWGLPVVLDLNNDGIAIIPLSQSTARFDLAGTGSRQVLAWPGPEDALFVYDRDGDRLISHKDEIAFKDYLKTAKTDLEGLAWFDQLAQGGNEDGILDDRDAAWSKFGVWRDADQDGVTDEGELRMTGDGSPKSLNLSSDGQRRNVGPDARSFGRGTYEYIDHNGIVQTADHYDVALRLEKEKATAKALYPSHGEAKRPLPPLMRLDGQPQTAGERMYPMMAYNQERHVRWPDWAVQKVIKYNPSRTAELARR